MSAPSDAALADRHDGIEEVLRIHRGLATDPLQRIRHRGDEPGAEGGVHLDEGQGQVRPADRVDLELRLDQRHLSVDGEGVEDAGHDGLDRGARRRGGGDLRIDPLEGGGQVVEQRRCSRSITARRMSSLSAKLE